MTLGLDKAIYLNIIQYMLNYIPSKSKTYSPPVDLGDLSRWLKVLSEPKRLLLLDQIIRGVQCNCDLGDELDMSPNLISHHLGVLREIGLVNTERDPLDARWVYYTIDRTALEQLNGIFGAFFDPDRILPRRATCGPQTLACIPDADVFQK